VGRGSKSQALICLRKITSDEVSVAEYLASNHEEADTKLVALTYVVIFVLIDNGTGKAGKIIDVTSSTLDHEKRLRNW
jgi:hypothetical protein